MKKPAPTNTLNSSQRYDNILAPASKDTDKHYSVSERRDRDLRMSASSVVITHMHIDYHDVQEHRDALSTLLNEAISNLERSWAEIARAYVELRFDYLRRSRI